MNVDKILIGSDPEVFLVDNDGLPVSAIGLLGGTKDEPRPVKGGAVQEDNVLAEFNIEPANSSKKFLSSINGVMKELQDLLPKYNLVTTPSLRFPFETLMESGPEAFAFGCDPDYNAWTGLVNPRPEADGTLRTAGGHVHVGHEGITNENAEKVIRVMDFYLGVPSVLLDKDKDRRTLYGRAGAYRRKEYGVEYRTLSNFWLASDNYIEWVYQNAVRAVQDLEFLPVMLEEFSGEVVQTTINKSDEAMAQRIVETLQIRVPKFV